MFFSQSPGMFFTPEFEINFIVVLLDGVRGTFFNPKSTQKGSPIEIGLRFPVKRDLKEGKNINKTSFFQTTVLVPPPPFEPAEK
ncbi:MAG: hypothetical protein ACI845_001670 [Gammaproteobacteria bacterium]|jgi:hypothetical protein